MKKSECLKEIKKEKLFSERAYHCPKLVKELKFRKLNSLAKSDLAKDLADKSAVKVCVLQTGCKTLKGKYSYTPIVCIYLDANGKFDWFADTVPTASLNNVTE